MSCRCEAWNLESSFYQRFRMPILIYVQRTTIAAVWTLIVSYVSIDTGQTCPVQRIPQWTLRTCHQLSQKKACPLGLWHHTAGGGALSTRDCICTGEELTLGRRTPPPLVCISDRPHSYNWPGRMPPTLTPKPSLILDFGHPSVLPRPLLLDGHVSQPLN